MIIKKWWFTNFMSYGNNETVIEFLEDKGELILLSGSNGGGKTGLIRAVDFSLFGEVLNKRGKRLAQKLIPNRTNGNCSTGVEFATGQYDKVEITRNLSGALKSELKVDGEPYTKAGKIQQRIDEITGFDIDTFKSFISLDLNIFKDFINLSPEDKRTILDKLFNLQVINELNKVLKQLRSQNDTVYSSTSREIEIYEQQIESLSASIKEASDIVEKIDNSSKIKNLKEEISKFKDTYIELEESKDNLAAKIEKVDAKLVKHGAELTKLNEKAAEINRDLKDVNRQIALFDSGKCPTCGTDLSVQLDIKSDLVERRDTTIKILEEVNNTIKDARLELEGLEEKYDALDESYKTVSKEFDKLTRYLTEAKSKIKFLKEQQEEEPVNTPITVFETNLNKNKEKLKVKKEEFIESQKLKLVYDTLSPIWGENGIKRDIIDEIVGPINQYIQEDLSVLGSKFTVELDNNFDVTVFEWGTDIDSDTLSTGEGKKINLIIMLAYIKMIRLKRHINLLVLDEVFAGIDTEGIDFILNLMKKYANERGINIIVVHHTDLNKSLFDRVLTINKTHYSQLTDERINS